MFSAIPISLAAAESSCRRNSSPVVIVRLGPYLFSSAARFYAAKGQFAAEDSCMTDKMMHLLRLWAHADPNIHGLDSLDQSLAPTQLVPRM
jgi:hypothetical protein